MAVTPLSTPSTASSTCVWMLCIRRRWKFLRWWNNTVCHWFCLPHDTRVLQTGWILLYTRVLFLTFYRFCHCHDGRLSLLRCVCGLSLSSSTVGWWLQRPSAAVYILAVTPQTKTETGRATQFRIFWEPRLTTDYWVHTHCTEQKYTSTLAWLQKYTNIV